MSQADGYSFIRIIKCPQNAAMKIEDKGIVLKTFPSIPYLSQDDIVSFNVNKQNNLILVATKFQSFLIHFDISTGRGINIELRQGIDEYVGAVFLNNAIIYSRLKLKLDKSCLTSSRGKLEISGINVDAKFEA